MMNVLEIMKRLPHRYPFLLVDRIIDIQPNVSITGIKNVTINEPFFQGHFPGNPVMPGVLQLEAMAQVGGIMMNRILKTDGEIAYFLSVDGARFRRMVVPGDTIRIEAELLRMRLNMCKIKGTVTVDGEVASEAELMFGRKAG